MHDTVSLVLVRFLALSSYFLVPVSLIVPSIRYRQILIPLLEKREHEKSFSSFYVNSSESISHLLVKMLGRISNDRLLIILLIINYFINRTINVLTIYRKDESFWFRFQPTIDLARHSTFDGFNLEEEFIVRRERKISLDDERGRPRIQSSVRLRRVGRRCNGRFGKEMENCAATVSLRGWFRARNSVSVLPFTVPFNLEGSRWETSSRPLPFLASFFLHQLRIMCKIEGLNAHQIGGCLSIVAYSIFLPSYFSRNHPLLFPFSLFASTSPTRKYLSTFSRGIHRSESLFRKADKHTNGNFQGSDEWSIDLVENKDWCLRGDRVRCQLSGTRTGRHFGERYATWRFGTVSNLSHGHQVINFGSIYHNKSVKWIFPFRSMILSRRINDDDHRDGFTKWPFMTTHTWGEYPQGNWLLEVSNRVVPFLSLSSLCREKIEYSKYRIVLHFVQVSFNTQTPQHGWIREWTLMLHGTREPPYTGLPAADPHSKLAIVKKAHEERSSAM